MKILVATMLIVCASSLFAQSTSGTKNLSVELSIAAAEEDWIKVRELLFLGVNPNQPDSSGKTALRYAVDSGQFNLVKDLLESGSSPDTVDKEGWSPLTIVIRTSRDDLLNLLLDNGADPNLIVENNRVLSALSLALDRGEYEMASRLIRGGAYPLLIADPILEKSNPLQLPLTLVSLDGRIVRDTAMLWENVDSPDWNMERWPLHIVARERNWFGARAELDAGRFVDVQDFQGVTPLMVAAAKGYTSLVSLFLDRGANPLKKDKGGRTAVCYAAAGGSLEVLNRILSGTKTLMFGEQKSLTASPWYYALAEGKKRIMEELHNRGISPFGKDSEGVNILMAAVWLRDAYAISFLVPSMNLREVDNAGRTALDWSLSAFDRDRRVGREIGEKNRGFVNYPIVRALADKPGTARRWATPTPYTNARVIEAWSPSGNAVDSEWIQNSPSPFPQISGDGDLKIYRILRGEDQD